MSHDQIGAKIAYPQKTSEWGKSLIDMLNVHFENVSIMIKSVNDNIDSKFAKFREDINEIRAATESTKALAEQNKKDIVAIRSEIRSEFECLNFTCEKLANENKTLKQQNNKLENYSRRNNVIIRGITEDENESVTSCAENYIWKVTQLMN